jgi:hypothetical protein
MLFKPLDYCIAIPALGAVIVSFFFVYTDTGGHSVVNLKGESGEWVFPVNAVETVNVSGPLGNTVIEINGGEARVVSSPCMNQPCVAAGSVRLPGHWTACLPNRVMLYVSEGQTENDVDATVW